MPLGAISGSLSVLFLYDVCDEIRLDELRKSLGIPSTGRERPFRHHAPEYVQFARPPIIEPLAASELDYQQSASGRLAYYDYGVISLEVNFPFQGGWDDAIDFSARWMNAPELEQRAGEILRRHRDRARPALVNPYTDCLSEDYFIFYLREISGGDGQPVTAEQLLDDCGDYIAQIVRGEHAKFSASERAEIL